MIAFECFGVAISLSGEGERLQIDNLQTIQMRTQHDNKFSGSIVVLMATSC
jgi:hypothetical protein